MNLQYARKFVTLIVLVIGLCTATGCYYVPRSQPSPQTYMLDVPNFDTLTPKQTDIAKYESVYKGFDGVYQYYYYTLEQRGTYRAPNLFGKGSYMPYKFHKYRRYRYVVLNPNVQGMTTNTITLDEDETLVNAYSIVWPPDGSKPMTYDLGKYKYYEDNDKREYKIAYSNIKAGSIIEEATEVVEEGVATGLTEMLEMSLPCEHLLVRIVYPQKFSIQIKNIKENTAPILKYEDYPDDNTQVATYDTTNIPGVKNEPNSPYIKDIAAYLQIKFKWFTHYPSILPSKWEDVSDFYKNYSISNSKNLDQNVDLFAQSLTRKSTTPLQKLDTIITYIQKNIEPLYRDRANEMGGNWGTADVLENKKGIIPSINGLAQAMLKSVGITSDFVLVRDGRRGYFDPDFVLYNEFTFNGLLAKIDNRDYLVFPATAEIPTTYVPPFFQEETAMRITPEGGSDYSFIPLKPENLGEGTKEETYDITISGEGMLTVKETKEYKGAEAYSVRSDLEDLPKEELEKEVKKLLTYTSGDVKVKNYNISNLKEPRLPLVITFEYTVDNLVTVTPDEVIFQTAGLFSPISEERSRIESDDRQNPIKIFYNSSSSKNIKLSYPASWKLTTALSDAAIENVFGSVNVTYTRGAGEFSAKQVRSLKRTLQPKEKVSDLLTLVGKKSPMNIPTLVFSAK